MVVLGAPQTHSYFWLVQGENIVKFVRLFVHFLANNISLAAVFSAFIRVLFRVAFCSHVVILLCFRLAQLFWLYASAYCIRGNSRDEVRNAARERALRKKKVKLPMQTGKQHLPSQRATFCHGPEFTPGGNFHAVVRICAWNERGEEKLKRNYLRSFSPPDRDEVE